MNSVVLDTSSDRVSAADTLYHRAIQANREEPQTYYFYARFLENSNQLTRAEKFHLQGLEVCPISSVNLYGYARLLRNLGQDLWAEAFEEKAGRCSLRETAQNDTNEQSAPGKNSFSWAEKLKKMDSKDCQKKNAP